MILSIFCLSLLCLAVHSEISSLRNLQQGTTVTHIDSNSNVQHFGDVGAGESVSLPNVGGVGGTGISTVTTVNRVVGQNVATVGSSANVNIGNVGDAGGVGSYEGGSGTVNIGNVGGYGGVGVSTRTSTTPQSVIVVYSRSTPADTDEVVIDTVVLTKFEGLEIHLSNEKTFRLSLGKCNACQSYGYPHECSDLFSEKETSLCTSYTLEECPYGFCKCKICDSNQDQITSKIANGSFTNHKDGTYTVNIQTSTGTFSGEVRNSGLRSIYNSGSGINNIQDIPRVQLPDKWPFSGPSPFCENFPFC
eukprot:Filipodium_phascolosomae@DN2897_c0_g1_i1.p1